MNPTTYTPASLDDFCGPARQVAELLVKLAARGGTHRLLLKGPPGTGKSSLARWFCHHLNSQPSTLNSPSPVDWNTLFYNGTQVNIEAVDRFHEHIRYTSHGYRCILIDEADAIPPTAQTRMLSFLDTVKSLKTGIAVVATSNYDFDKFPERLQTRFKVLDVPGPTEAELTHFLQRFTLTSPTFLAELAHMAHGGEQHGCNVRQALDDLDTALLAQAA